MCVCVCCVCVCARGGEQVRRPFGRCPSPSSHFQKIVRGNLNSFFFFQKILHHPSPAENPYDGGMSNENTTWCPKPDPGVREKQWPNRKHKDAHQTKERVCVLTYRQSNPFSIFYGFWYAERSSFLFVNIQGLQGVQTFHCLLQHNQML